MVLLDDCHEPISYEITKKIMEQMNNYICKIFTKENDPGTGFFCFIHIKTKKIPVLI